MYQYGVRAQVLLFPSFCYAVLFFFKILACSDTFEFEMAFWGSPQNSGKHSCLHVRDELFRINTKEQEDEEKED